MSNRILASPKQRRGEITTDADINRLFQHLIKDKPEPANPKTNPWKLKPFKGIIRGEFHQSPLHHDIEVTIKNGMQYADYLNISKRSFLYLIYEDFPNGSPTNSKTLANAKVSEYNKTLCHRYLAKHYQNRITGEWSDQGKMVEAMGKYLYAKFNQKDPALFSLEDFQEAKKDAHFYNEQGKIKFDPLSKLRCIMQFVALQIEDSPLSKRHFQFLEGDEWDTSGKKNIGGKKDDYLQENELKLFVENINEVDTLVLHRLGFEGGGRISSQLYMGKKTPNGYLCQPFWDLNAIAMFEPKVEESKIGGKVKRYFVAETMAFFKRYVDDFDIKGAWFKRWESDSHNYESYSSSIKAAGYRAGIWRFKTAQKGQELAKGEKVSANGHVYRLKAVSNNLKGTQGYKKQWLTEGKMTTTHTTMKHTFVSLAGLHGLSLDDCAEQCGTDPTTIRDFYHGTLGDKLRSVILGEKTFEPWKDWIHRFVNPLYAKRYNELISQSKTAVDLKVIAQEEAVMAEVA